MLKKDEFFLRNLKVPLKMPLSGYRQTKAQMGKGEPPCILFKTCRKFYLLFYQSVSQGDKNSWRNLPSLEINLN